MICRAIPYEGSEPYIFVSYCHKDKEKLYPLFEQMVLDGCRMWYDDGNHAGDDWMDNIETHLEGCKVMVAFISGNSSLSHNCKNEVIYAQMCSKKIVPVLIESTALPKGLRMQLSSLHHLKASDFSSDKALLAKIYETEECKLCKASAGSFKLKPAAEEEKAAEKEKTGKGGFFSSLVHVSFGTKQKKEEEPVQEDVPEIAEEKPPAAKKATVKKKKLAARIVEKKPKKEEPSWEELYKKSSAKTAEEKPADPEEDEGEETFVPKEETGEETFVPKENSGDETIVSRGDTDGEKTVYMGRGSRGAAEDDGDKTVRISNRNLSILLHPAEQRAYQLRKPQTKIGRSPFKCDVVLQGNDSISKLHAEIIQFKDKCTLCDAGSANGTFLKGEQLEAGIPTPLENPAIFQLNDETLILLSGALARKFSTRESISLVMNSSCTALRVMENDTLLLNRDNKWPDGTLSDKKVHRAGHGKLEKRADGIYLIDESPAEGNGTYLNERWMTHGEARKLSSGDQIRLGDTTLEFVTIGLKE